MFNTSVFSSVIKAALSEMPQIEIIWIGLSGGLDSTVLLHAMKKLQQNDFPKFNLKAIHINHGLSLNALNWQLYCQQLCEQLDISFYHRTIEVRPKSRQSLEAVARDKRYEALAELIDANSCLFTAHHQDDQAETLMLQLLRGSGVDGLACMPFLTQFSKGYLCRPLLDFMREELHAYAIENNLKWINDESNENLKFDRNYIRYEIMPRLKTRWPSVTKTFSRTAKLCAEASEFLAEGTTEKIQQLKGTKENTLSVKKLLPLNEATQRQVLKQWIKNQEIPLPSYLQLQQLQKDMLHCRLDRKPIFKWPGAEVRREKDDLIAFLANNI